MGGYATLTLADTPEAGDLAGKDIRVPLTLETGHRYADALAFFVFLGGSILCLRLFGTTPGKRIMGLRVIGAAPIPALRRELVRSLPHLLTVPTFLVINLILRPMPAVPPIAQAIAISLELLSIAAVLAFWVYPALRWRGAFFHDRLLGLSVVRAHDLPADPPPTA
ncbi:MAG: RDD family protein [Rhodobacteraceae bacterium]|nr:RDD family protein [Paracoccaceae bacterium]